MNLQNCMGVLFDDDSMSNVYESEPICLYYYQDENVFVDEDGNIIWNVFEYVTPNDVYLLRKHQEYMVVRHRTTPGLICELHYPSEDEYYYFRDVCHEYG